MSTMRTQQTVTEAIVAMQSFYGIPPTGIIDTQTVQ